MACAHEHIAIGFASGYKLDICHFQQGVGTQLHFNLNVDLVMQVLFLFSWAPYYYVLHSVMDREVTRD